MCFKELIIKFLLKKCFILFFLYVKNIFAKYFVETKKIILMI